MDRQFPKQPHTVDTGWSFTVDLISHASGIVQGSVNDPWYSYYLLVMSGIYFVTIVVLVNYMQSTTDVKLYTTLCVNDDIKHMRNSLNALYTWYNTWQLNISTSKCTTMQVHAVTECPNLHLNNITLIKVNEFRDLGVIIYESLKFASHITSQHSCCQN